MSLKTESAAEPQIARDGTYYRAPEALKSRVLAALAGTSRADRVTDRATQYWRAFSFAAACSLVAFVSWNAALFKAGAVGDDAIERELVAAHVRSVQSEGHFNDVVSTDQHTVKPWFTGKLDFAPPVMDYPAAGFALAGGRLDYVGGRNVAAITYRHRRHAVNLFVWPEMGAADAAPRTASRNGYSIVSWNRGGMHFAAVSDVAAAELASLADASSLLIDGPDTPK